MQRLGFLLLAALAVASTGQIGYSQPNASPNVVFFLADDLGWTQTSAYGSSYYRTPNLDRLAAGGVRFTQAYSAAAICSPTRASILTGKYPARLHLTNFIPGGEPAGTLLQQPAWRKFLPLEEITMAEVFRDRGYRTALFGKWHLSPEKFGHPANLPFYPDKQGFDEHLVIDKPERRADPEADPHKSDLIGERSVQFIRRNPGKPFFLFASYSAIHNPLMDGAEAIARWKEVTSGGQPENRAVIGAMLERMDRSIGRILDTLDELGIANNTLVVFYSDNGGLASDASQAPLRSGKGFLYEGGIRVPLIMRWPAAIRAGWTSPEIVSSYDFLPTFCDALGAPHPVEFDGVSLLPMLRRESPLAARDHYWHYPHYHNVGMKPGGAIRRGRWKLIENYELSLTGKEESARELYDIESDLGETINLAGRHPALTAELAAALKNWRDRVGAQMPEPTRLPPR